jgi:hypothetical protein
MSIAVWSGLYSVCHPCIEYLKTIEQNPDTSVTLTALTAQLICVPYTCYTKCKNIPL